MAEEVTPVTDFLSKYLEDGQLESQGQFTISPQKALEKFGRHAFPRRTAWLTKLLQAVALAHKPEMKVVTQPDKLSVTLSGIGFVRSADTLLQIAFDMDKCGFGSPLIDGLRYLAATCPEQLDLICVKSPRCQIARFQREGVELFELDWQEKTEFLEIQINGERDLGSPSEMAEELKIAAGFLDFPVTLNGKKLQGSLAKSDSSGHVPGPGKLAMNLLSDRLKREQRTMAGLPVRSKVRTDEAQCCYVTRSSRNGRIVLNWIHDGVVLKRESAPANGNTEVQLLLPFDADKADLGGFDFQPSPRSKQRVWNG